MDNDIDLELADIKLLEGQVDLSEGIKYITAGKCIFTFVNTVSGTHVTYKCNAAKGANNKVNRNLYFLSALCGPDNTSDYKYFALIRMIGGKPVYEFAEKSKLTKDSKMVKAFEHIWSNLMVGNTFSSLEMYYSSKCCRCGRTLTVDKSIKAGFGAVCARLFTQGK